MASSCLPALEKALYASETDPFSLRLPGPTGSSGLAVRGSAGLGERGAGGPGARPPWSVTSGRKIICSLGCSSEAERAFRNLYIHPDTWACGDLEGAGTGLAGNSLGGTLVRPPCFFPGARC